MVKRIPKTILKKIEGSESIDTEFKEIIPASLRDSIIAFANRNGGTIIIGVTEKKDKGRITGEIKGLENPDITGDRDKIRNWASDLQPPVDVSFYDYDTDDGKTIYVIRIKESKSKPVGTLSGTYKIRVEGGTRGLDPQSMRHLIIGEESIKQSLLYEFNKNIKFCNQLNRQLREGKITYGSFRTVTLNSILTNVITQELFDDYEKLERIFYMYGIANRQLELLHIKKPTKELVQGLLGNAKRIKDMISGEVKNLEDK
jgi:hypothetical protein